MNRVQPRAAAEEKPASWNDPAAGLAVRPAAAVVADLAHQPEVCPSGHALPEGVAEKTAGPLVAVAEKTAAPTPVAAVAMLSAVAYLAAAAAVRPAVSAVAAVRPAVSAVAVGRPAVSAVAAAVRPAASAVAGGGGHRPQVAVRPGRT